jgi:hypothetical protein
MVSWVVLPVTITVLFIAIVRRCRDFEKNDKSVMCLLRTSQSPIDRVPLLFSYQISTLV